MDFKHSSLFAIVVQLNLDIFNLEIGHNLGLDHSDKTTIMKQNNLIKINSTMNGTSVITDYASIDKRRVFLMINRVNVPRVSPLGILMTK